MNHRPVGGRRGSRFVAHVVLACAALLLTACPPPSDADGGGIAKPPRPTRTPDPKPTTGGTDSTTGPAPAPVTEDVVVPEGTDTPTAVIYERLNGGIAVPRCPACGEVQPPDASRCAGCGQAIVPRRQETKCTVCDGGGDCGTCGDDRPCSACDGDGDCPYCDGSGARAGETCIECDGKARCTRCGGDGIREAARGDFGPLETALPGICPTCIDGSGYCPECGTSSQDQAGGKCLSCAGAGLCHDCRGEGRCPHDRGDGECPACGGHGREVVNGPPPERDTRIWNLRMAVGTVIQGRVTKIPSPNIAMEVFQRGSKTHVSHVKSKVAPVAYLRVMRHFIPTTAETEYRERMDLALFAKTEQLWPLAIRELQLAVTSDPSRHNDVEAQTRDVAARRQEGWVARAEQALRAGDRETAMRLLQMVRYDAIGTAIETRAKALQLDARNQSAREAETLDDETKAARAAEAATRISRTVERARLRLDRVRGLLDTARDVNLPEPELERIHKRAETAAWEAQRMVLREAWRQPSGGAAWSEEPSKLVNEARILRSTAAEARARHSVTRGRFELAASLAAWAMRLDPRNPQARKVLEEAELGRLRKAVLQGSAPPRVK